MKLTLEQREVIVKKLVDKAVDKIAQLLGERDVWYLSEILQHGFKGFNNFTDEELIKENEIVFNNSI